jgi:glucosamine-phosphate N-acetyltransferase
MLDASRLGSPPDRKLRRAVRSDDPRFKPETLARLDADRVQHAYVLVDGSGAPCASATMLLEPKLLRGGTTVAHVCEMSAIPPESSSSSYAPVDLLAQLIEEARRAGCYKIIADARPEAVEAFLSVGFREAQMAMEVDLGPAEGGPSWLVTAALGVALAAGALTVASACCGRAITGNSAAVATSWLALLAGAGSVAQRRAKPLVSSTAARRIDVLRCSPGSEDGEGEMSFRLRRLSPSNDQAAYLGLLAQLSVAPPMEPAAFAAQLQRAQGSGAHAILVAEPLDGRPIVACGTLLVERRVLGGAPYLVAHIEDVVVDQSMRGCGLGRKIIEHLLVVAGRAGCARATLNCTPENAAFYQRCGMHLSAAAGLALYF